VSHGVVLVLPEASLDDAANHAGCDLVVAGGLSRSDSVRAGLAAVPESATIVIVHDAARPLATRQLFDRVIAGLATDIAGVIPGVLLADTVKRVKDGAVLETISRDELRAIQTPQAFRAVILRAAHANGDDATDDAALVEAIGGTVRVVDGESANLKITERADLSQLEAIIADLAAKTS
jgi:2-C-methyl-D-erythritol 4-phosphate cytidylyltransferase